MIRIANPMTSGRVRMERRTAAFRCGLDVSPVGTVAADEALQDRASGVGVATSPFGLLAPEPEARDLWRETGSMPAAPPGRPSLGAAPLHPLRLHAQPPGLLRGQRERGPPRARGRGPARSPPGAPAGQVHRRGPLPAHHRRGQRDRRPVRPPGGRGVLAGQRAARHTSRPATSTGRSRSGSASTCRPRSGPRSCASRPPAPSRSTCSTCSTSTATSSPTRSAWPPWRAAGSAGARSARSTGPASPSTASPSSQVDGKLALGEARAERVLRAFEGRGFADDLAAGDWVSIHWGWICETPRRPPAGQPAQGQRRPPGPGQPDDLTPPHRSGCS